MKLLLNLLSTLLLAGAAGNLLADDRVDHFEGEPAATLEQAVANFSDYNARLAEVLARDELTAADLVTVHELTYTLENALGKINAELATLSETLEALHLASEALDYEGARARGREYLDTATRVID